MSLQWLSENLTLMFAIPAAIFAYLQWHRDQAWKRTTAAFERIRSFDETPGTRNAMMILKSPQRDIPLWDRLSPPPRGPYISVTWEEAKWALIPTSREAAEGPKANAIRDSFEDLMNRMTQIEMFVEARLLREKDVKHLVVPWAKRLCSDSRVDDGGLSRNFRVYVEDENKVAVQKLFARYNFDLRFSLEQDRKALSADLSARLAERETSVT